MATKDTILVLNEEDKNRLLKKSAKYLPSNPSNKGYSAAQVQAALFEPSLLNFEYLSRLASDVREALDQVDNKLGSKIDKEEGKSLITDEEREKWNTDLNLLLTVEEYQVGEIAHTFTTIHITLDVGSTGQAGFRLNDVSWVDQFNDLHDYTLYNVQKLEVKWYGNETGYVMVGTSEGSDDIFNSGYRENTSLNITEYLREGCYIKVFISN